MGYELDWTLASKIAEKDGAVNILNGNKPGDSVDAAKLFAATIPEICELADKDTFCLIHNVQAIRSQTVEIATTHHANPEVISAIKPIAERFNLDI